MMAHGANKGHKTGPSLFPSPPLVSPTQAGTGVFLDLPPRVGAELFPSLAEAGGATQKFGAVWAHFVVLEAPGGSVRSGRSSGSNGSGGDRGGGDFIRHLSFGRTIRSVA